MIFLILFLDRVSELRWEVEIEEHTIISTGMVDKKMVVVVDKINKEDKMELEQLQEIIQCN
jgi:hypothetical protein